MWSIHRRKIELWWKSKLEANCKIPSNVGSDDSESVVAAVSIKKKKERERERE